MATEKKNRLIPVLLAIVFIALIGMNLLQYRQNTILKRELNAITLSEKDQSNNTEKDNLSRVKPVNPTSKINLLAEDGISGEEKIKKLESQIADMQAWQDYLEESLEKYKQEEEWQNDTTKRLIKSIISSRVDGFAEEVNLSSDVKTKLYNMLFDKEMEIREILSGDIPRDDRKQGMEYISEKYDEMISDLLVGNYPAYSEYVKVQMERNYVTDFNNSMLMRDNQLDKQQEKRLIAVIYSENQAFSEIRKDNKENVNISPVEIMKENLEIQKILHNRYIDSAGDILSESQMHKFQKYLDEEISRSEINLNTTISMYGNTDIKDSDQ